MTATRTMLQPPVLAGSSTPVPRTWRTVLKRALDLAGSAAGLIVLAPVLAVLAAVIRFSSRGRALYRQERLGQGGRVFTMYKYRTMIDDAEAGGPRWSAGAADPRITRVGRLLRSSHLDELPQLWNVFTGDMSLVGPRPERPCFLPELQRLVPGYLARYRVKPGMTGLAQVHYRYDATIADVKRKLRYDRLYVQRMCLGLDMKILVWTFAVVFGRRGQ